MVNVKFYGQNSKSSSDVSGTLHVAAPDSGYHAPCPEWQDFATSSVSQLSLQIILGAQWSETFDFASTRVQTKEVFLHNPDTTVDLYRAWVFQTAEASVRHCVGTSMP